MITQQTPSKGKQNLKKYVVFAIMIAVFAGCMWLIFALSGDKQAEKEETGFNTDIPNQRGDDIVSERKTAYEQEQVQLRQEEKMRSPEQHSILIGAIDENSEEYKRKYAWRSFLRIIRNN